jgi:hypothetical protein
VDLSYFERWERAAKLQLEMLQTLGEFEKARADAAKTRAQAKNVNERNRTIEIINRRLEATQRSMLRQTYLITQQRKRIQQNAVNARILKTCQSAFKSQISLAWSALYWFIGECPAGSLFEAYSQEIDGVLIGEWMAKLRSENRLPSPGSAGHLAILKLMAAVDASRDGLIENLESQRRTLKAEQHADLTPLKEILGVAKE